MTQEEKNLLLKELCARLPYGVKISPKEKDTGEYDEKSGSNYMYPDVISVEAFIPDGDNARIEYEDWIIYLDNIQLYLRPMESMTEEEKEELNDAIHEDFKLARVAVIENDVTKATSGFNKIDWLNAHHFDYRGLIPMGLAIAVTEENNPYKKK